MQKNNDLANLSGSTSLPNKYACGTNLEESFCINNRVTVKDPKPLIKKLCGDDIIKPLRVVVKILTIIIFWKSKIASMFFQKFRTGEWKVAIFLKVLPLLHPSRQTIMFFIWKVRKSYDDSNHSTANTSSWQLHKTQWHVFIIIICKLKLDYEINSWNWYHNWSK